MRPVCKRCGVKPAALDGNGEQLDWCIDCIWELIQRELPRVGACGGMKGDMIDDMIDRALVSMLTRGLKKFTANDVQAETIKLGYKTPSRPYINHRLQERAKSNLVKLVTDLPVPQPNISTPPENFRNSRHSQMMWRQGIESLRHH